MKNKRYSRFTLVELLVVISIVAILASLLLPAVSKAREKSKTILCKSSLKQAGQLIYSYLNDYQDYFPAFTSTGTNSYDGKMKDYAPNPSFFTCPSSSEEEVTYNYANRLYKGKYWPVTLALEIRLGLMSPPTFKQLKLTEIANPGRAVIVADAESRNNASGTYYYGTTTLDSIYRQFRHENNKVHNYLYLAGGTGSVKGTNTTVPYNSYGYYYHKTP